MRATSLRPTFSEYIPGDLEAGILYISVDYATAVHLCACGCRSKVITPFGPADWQLIFDGTVSLRPSIGNGHLPCHSHYYIRHDRIQWLRAISAGATEAAGERDRAALRDLHTQRHARSTWWSRIRARVRAIVGSD